VRLYEVVGHRIYTDFLMPSRMGEYRSLLESALDSGYSIVAIDHWWRSVVEDSGDVLRPHLILRHDVDTDPRTAETMWRIESSLRVSSSYFFRLSTLDLGLIERIASSGGHVGYHYEELATVARHRRPRDRDAALRLVPEARELFARNLRALRDSTGLTMDIVASHGDFLNRRLDVRNNILVADEDFRAEVGVRLETYDERFLHSTSSYHRDLPPPARWMPEPPEAAIERRERTIYALVHPRPWRVNRRVNAVDDLRRLLDEVTFRAPLGST